MYNGFNLGVFSGGVQNMYNNMLMNRNLNYNLYGGQSNMMSGMNNYNVGINDMVNGLRFSIFVTLGLGVLILKSVKVVVQVVLMVVVNQQRLSGRLNILFLQVMYGQGGFYSGFLVGMINFYFLVFNFIGFNFNMLNFSSVFNMVDFNFIYNFLFFLQEGSNF